MKLLIFTLDLARNNYPIITTVNGLPYDCTSLLPCSTLLGGVVVLTSNSIIYVDQSARRVPLPLNGWQQRISDLPIPVLSPEDQQCNLELEGCRAAFIDGKTFVIVLRDGTVYPVEVTVDGKTVSKLSIGPALARATIPSVLKRVTDDLLFLGSTVASSLLLRTFHVEEEIKDDPAPKVPVIPTVNAGAPMDLDDDDGTLSSLTYQTQAHQSPLQISMDHRLCLRNLPTITSTIATAQPGRCAVCYICHFATMYPPMALFMTWHFRWPGTEFVDCHFFPKLTSDSTQDRPVPELVAATGSGWLGGFTLFQVCSRLDT